MTVWSLQIGLNFAFKDSKSKTSLSLLLFIFVYNKLVIVIAGFTLFLLRNAFLTKHYVTKITSEWWIEWLSERASEWVSGHEFRRFSARALLAVLLHSNLASRAPRGYSPLSKCLEKPLSRLRLVSYSQGKWEIEKTRTQTRAKTVCYVLRFLIFTHAHLLDPRENLPFLSVAFLSGYPILPVLPSSWHVPLSVPVFWDFPDIFLSSPFFSFLLHHFLFQAQPQNKPTHSQSSAENRQKHKISTLWSFP